MQTLRLAVVTFLVVSVSVPASAASEERQLKAMLTEFLDAASTGGKGKPVFERFFADDVIYTRSTAQVLHKSDLMKSVDQPPPADAPKTTYDQADTTIHLFGDNLAIVNFQLVRRVVADKPEIRSYRNTATFLKRNNRWQVIAWQSTAVPK